MKLLKLRVWLSLLTTMLLMAGCQDIMDNYRESKELAHGSAWQILEERGNYGVFLHAVEKAGYRRLLDGGGLVTVFAPADDAFRPYLQEKYGTGDPAAIDTEELAITVSYHMIQFSYTRHDLLAFSIESTDDRPIDGDGSCYKYKTYAREAVEQFTDPYSHRQVSLFSREKYLPVFSSRIFANRDISDAEDDYRMLFPNVNWHGTDDELYAGEAYVSEGAIPTDNGYLYIVDKALAPMPTIYKALRQPDLSDYSQFRRLYERFNRFTYNQAISKNYAAPGDSLFLFYHYKNPQGAAELPEIASEWGYHDESGVVFDRALRYSTTLFTPKNQLLDTYLKDYFSEYGTQTSEDYQNLIPNNAVYHFLMAHAYGQRNLILPSELDQSPVLGSNGEHFDVSKSELTDVKMCTNGVVYGMEKVFVPATFTCLTKPLFKYPQFRFFALAFNTKNMYLQTTDRYNRFTLIILNDEDMATLGYTCSETAYDWGNYTFRSSSSNMNANAVSTIVMRHFFYGDIPDPRDNTNPQTLRYYVAKDGNSYSFSIGGKFYNHEGSVREIKNVFETENGNVYQFDKLFTRNGNGIMDRLGTGGEYSTFRTMMNNAGLLSGTSIGSWMANSILFCPTNAAITAGISSGAVPTYTGTLSDEQKQTLRDYVRYHFIPISKNKLPHYLLPGLGPNGRTNEAYEVSLATFVEALTDADLRYMTVGWDPNDAGRMKLTDAGNNVIYTKDIGTATVTDNNYASADLPAQRSNALIYKLESCFDHRTMYGN